jgi:hypothetical protein
MCKSRETLPLTCCNLNNTIKIILQIVVKHLKNRSMLIMKFGAGTVEAGTRPPHVTAPIRQNNVASAPHHS